MSRLVEDQVGLELVRVADLAERLARLEPLADRLGVGHAHDLAVAGGDEGELADLLVDLLDGRLEVLGHLVVLASPGRGARGRGSGRTSRPWRS